MRKHVRSRIRRATAKRSEFWLFRQTRGDVRSRNWTVEVRINVPAERLDEIGEVGGWQTARIDKQLEALFVRRTQPLTDRDCRRLFSDAVRLARKYGGRFHLWMHEPDIVPVSDE